MNYLRVSIVIFLLLAASRFIPHPPNFTSLMALSFYVPALLGVKFLPALIICFGLTDLFLGFHGVMLFTWGSIIFIGLISHKFIKSIYSRISGALFGALIFFIVTNFGVWSKGMYGYSVEGLLVCYINAIPFFAYSVVSTFIFASIIETLYNVKTIKRYFNLVK